MGDLLDEDLLDDNLIEDSTWPLADLNSAVHDKKSSNLHCRSPVKEESPCMPSARAFRFDSSSTPSQAEEEKRPIKIDRLAANEEEKKEVIDGANDDSQFFEEEIGLVIQDAEMTPW